MKEEQNMSYMTKMKTCLKQTGQLHTLRKNNGYKEKQKEKDRKNKRQKLGSWTLITREKLVHYRLDIFPRWTFWNGQRILCFWFTNL